ncbi:hypothetical protein LCGC14_2122170 [marine sediment metagenome]|uniref:BppU N-terminal domain-containing protein n=1 Tax=marine sediment metagenome TaxID=412755 RepID=A0A0F9E3V5_9ZZZZ
MTVTIKSLKDGQLPSSKTTLYTVPAATQTVINRIRLVNTNSTAETINLYFKASGGTSRRIIPEDYSLAAKALFVMDDVLTMEVSDVVEGDTTTVSKVDYVISGAENS